MPEGVANGKDVRTAVCIFTVTPCDMGDMDTQSQNGAECA